MIWFGFFLSFSILVCLFLQILIFVLESLNFDVVMASSVASLSSAYRFVVCLSPGKLGNLYLVLHSCKEISYFHHVIRFSCVNFMFK